MKCNTAFKNNDEEPESFYVHTGTAGVGKSFLINAITEYVKRNPMYHGQKLEQPSIVATTSTGKVACHINGLTLHSAFHLQINGSHNINAQFCQPCKEIY